MPKKKKQSSKTTQTQSQKVIVNIGTATARKRKRRKGGGGAGPGGGGGYYHNLAPTIINSPQVDYTPLLAMMQYQTRSLQTEGIKNPVTPLSSVTQALPAEQMAGQAAIRRAGKTSADFSQQAHMDRREDEERVAMGQEDIEQDDTSTVPTPRSRASSISTVATEIEEAIEPPTPVATRNTLTVLPPLNVGPLKPSEDIAFVGALNRARPKLGAPFTTNVGNLPVGQELTPGRLVAERQGDFRPTGNPTGSLGAEETPRELIKQSGPLTQGEFNAYSYLQGRVDEGKELKPKNERKYLILRKRLQQFGSSKST